MKRLTIFFAFLAALLLAACEQEVERPMTDGEGSGTTWMSSLQPVSVSVQEPTFNIVLRRGVATSAMDVPITFDTTGKKVLIDAPQSISFAAGQFEKEVTLKADVTKLDPAATNAVKVSFDKKFLGATGINTITLNINVELSYTSIGKGTIQWDAWHASAKVPAEAFGVEILKADGFNIFRVGDPLMTSDGEEGTEMYRFSITSNGRVTGDAAFKSGWKYDDKYGHGILLTKSGKLLADGVELIVGLDLEALDGDPFGIGETPMIVKWPASYTPEGIKSIAADTVRIVKLVDKKVVDHEYDSVFVSKTISLVAVISPKTATSTDAAWKSLDEKIAKVDETGTVKGLAEGTARIVAYDPVDESVADTIVIRVDKIAAQKVKLSSKKLTIDAGKTTRLVATVEPDDATYKKVTWTSSSPKISFIEEQKGEVGSIMVVVANDAAKDSVTIVATSVDNSKLTDTCVVIIKAATAPVTPTTYAISVAEGIENGTVTVEPTEAAEGAEVTITATPADGYQLKAGTLKFNGTDVTENAGVYTFTMPAEAVTVTAEFELIPPTKYAISMATFTNGNVTADKTEAAAGETVTLTVSPEAGYQLKAGTLKFNGTNVTENAGVYTFTMPAEAVTVTAEFETATP